MPWDLETLVLMGTVVAAVSATVATFQEVDDAAGFDDAGPPRPKRTRMQYGRPDYWDNEWGKMLRTIRGAREAGSPNKRQEALFKLRFRLPFDLFEQQLRQMSELGGYVPSRGDYLHRDTIPLDIKFLCVLRIAARGWCFDDVSEVPSPHSEHLRVVDGVERGALSSSQ